MFPWLLQINWRWSRVRNQILEAHTHIARPPNSESSPIDPNPSSENMVRPLKKCIFEKKHFEFYAVISEVWGGNFSGCSDCLLSPFLNYLVSLTNREAIKYYCRQYLKEFRLFDMRLPLHIRTKHTCYLRFFHYLTNTWEILKKKLSVNSHKCIENCCEKIRPFRAFFP